MQRIAEQNIKTIEKYRKAQGLDGEVRYYTITDATTKETLMRDGFPVISVRTERDEANEVTRSFIFAVPNSDERIEATIGDVIAMNANEFWHANEHSCKLCRIIHIPQATR